jgi:hypothetical protein
MPGSGLGLIVGPTGNAPAFVSFLDAPRPTAVLSTHVK